MDLGLASKKTRLVTTLTQMPVQDRMPAAKPEPALWERLRRGQLGVQFKSQEHIHGYVVDFYCPSGNLIVEIDGGIRQTAEVRASDAKKDRALLRRGFRILRLPSTLTADAAVARIERKLIWLQVKRIKPVIKPEPPTIAA
jgi:very-short-patch-repair endonuclease